MPDSHEFHHLMERVQQGNQEAVQELLERYGTPVVRVIRRKLLKKLRRKYDSTDFAQAVWASFFAVDPMDYRFEHPRELVAYLVRMARNKVIEEVRHRVGSLKHCIHREISLEAAATKTDQQLADPGPTPSAVAVAHEEWARLLDGLPPMHRRILMLIEQGYTHREAAQELGLNERTIRRFLEKLSPKGQLNGESGKGAPARG
jgi:RNA polymerase sigma factor (sigma-70 family)